MIIVISLILLGLLFINFSLASNKIRILFILKIFMDIKRISYVLIKLILALLIFLFLNYNRYIYYSVGLTINHGYVFIYAFFLVLVL
jgi:hypothetical protein